MVSKGTVCIVLLDKLRTDFNRTDKPHKMVLIHLCFMYIMYRAAIKQRCVMILTMVSAVAAAIHINLKNLNFPAWDNKSLS